MPLNDINRRNDLKKEKSDGYITTGPGIRTEGVG